MKRVIQIISAVLSGALLLSLSSCTQEVKPQADVKPARIALVLGAGASKGFAHVGVLKVLESNNVPVHMIVGTSAGSFVGSLYAYGFNAFQLQKISLAIDRGEIADWTVPDNGFIKGEKLEDYINRMVAKTPLENMRIPFYAVATDVLNGSEVVFGKGNAGQAVRASCSIPGVFKPVKINDRYYVDGGVVSPVAVDAARRLGADIVIAVDISSKPEVKSVESTMDTIMQSVSIMYSRISLYQVAKADIVIRPRVGHIASSDFSLKHEAVMEGEKAAIESLPQIKALLSRLRAEGRL
ncbi:MAG: patatin-like phospholipase family protein [Nitrospiraceae bacterium]|nr:patatin-like phospholipase family protein [Nitrospiraceae bacterium]